MDNTLQILEVPDEDLENGDISNFRRVFGGISDRPNNAKILQGNVAIGFPKYEKDPRPNYIIEEIRSFIRAIDAALPFFFYFLWPEPRAGLIGFWLYCLSQPIPRKRLGLRWGYRLNPEEVVPLLVVRIDAVKHYCQRIADDCEPIIRKILASVPHEISSLAKERYYALHDSD